MVSNSLQNKIHPWNITQHTSASFSICMNSDTEIRMCQQGPLGRRTLGFISCQMIHSQTSVCVGGREWRPWSVLLQGICIANKDELLQPCYRQRDVFTAQTAAVCAFNSKASQFRGQCVGGEVLSHDRLSSCLIWMKLGLKSPEMTRTVTVPWRVWSLFSGGVLIQAKWFKVHWINFSCLLAPVVGLSAPLKLSFMSSNYWKKIKIK